MEPINNSLTIANARTLDRTDPLLGAGPAFTETSFDDVLAQKSKTREALSGQAGEVPCVDSVQESKSVERVEPSRMMERADTFARGIQDDQQRIDRMITRVARGGEVSQAELLRMQATTYRYAQCVDFATKVVEKTANGVKQMMNTQV